MKMATLKKPARCILIGCGALLIPYFGGCDGGGGGGGGGGEVIPATEALADSSPAEGASGVGLDASVVFTLRKAAVPDSIDGAFDPPVDFLDPVWSDGNTVVTVTPSQPLDPNTAYSVTISDLQFADGTQLGGSIVISFTTGDSSGSSGGGGDGGGCDAMDCPFDAASDQLSIVCVTPTPCSTDVPVDTDVVVEFNRAIDLEFLSGDLLSETGDTADLRVELSGDGTTATVSFEGGLQDNVTYGLAILEARDAQDNSLSNPGVFCFSTGSTLNCPELPDCAAFDATDEDVGPFADFDYSPPYADDSVWNTPIADNPSISSESDVIIASFAESFESFGGMFLSATQDAPPVYLADADTPRVNVSITSGFADSNSLEAPIPDFAIPDCGLDRFLTVFEQDAGLIYEFWRPMRNDDGSWQATVGSSSDVTGSGVFPAIGPNQTDGVRASGFALLAGAVWPHELAAGRIEHALVFVYPLTRANEVVAPATATDGVSSDPGSIPIGTLLQLDPDLDLGTLNLDPWEETIAGALQVYGMYCGDTGGGISITGIHVMSFEGNPYEGLLPDTIFNETGVLMPNVPADRFRVLSPPSN